MIHVPPAPTLAPTPAPALAPALAPADLPGTFRQAAWRAMRGHCPRCDGVGLFRKWLKPVDHCRSCGQDWVSNRADDFPAYIAIFVTGHALAPLMIALVRNAQISPALALAILIPLAVAMLLAMLQPAKGVVLAIMWWLGMGSFRKERPAGHADHPAAPGN